METEREEAACSRCRALEMLARALEAERERSAYWRARAKRAAKTRRGPNFRAYLAKERRRARQRKGR